MYGITLNKTRGDWQTIRRVTTVSKYLYIIVLKIVIGINLRNVLE